MSIKDRPMSSLTFNQAMGVARTIAVETFPYFATGILELVPQEAPGLGTFAVTERSILMADPAVLKTWSPNEAGAVTVHEYMHIFLNHKDRVRKLVAAGVLENTKEDWELANRCGDEEINQNLRDAGLKLPCFTAPDGTVIQPCYPEQFGHPPHRLMEEYIKIEKAKKPPPGNGKGDDGASPDPNAPPDPNGKHSPKSGCGHCGSGAGNPVPNEPPVEDPLGRSDVDQQISRKQVVAAIKEASKSRGKVPMGLQRFADTELENAKIPWQQQLSSETRAAVAFRPGAVDYTMKKPSRRQGAFMHMELKPVIPGMHAPIAEIAVAFDTSGSVGDRELQTYGNEAMGVLRHMGGAKITFLSCDAKVHAMVRTRSIAEIKANTHGGGGTDFRPVFEAIEKVRPRPNVLVFFTDGYGTYPQEPPKGIKVIWVNVGGHISAGWGTVINTDPNHRDEDEDDVA
jgi:predicted metal-dependent peptidase